ncbi:helix-turn-helix domain-containing protein [Mycobacterium sp. SMC-8]|uniref:PucR family transcriptional regulator n=1 Tax=Mycobacterium sp. SMC-8 TaxID=2857060 RepID=UPI0021B4847A|nr:helix-turn-helix domain-containing protein [Mycobacterium sp. SMC-8]UXA11051.1 helix-turn-helix domain-containing protein [Mycobacterium sp. SMC-8]
MIAESGGDGAVGIPGRAWGWAFPLRPHDVVEGALVVSAAEQPSSSHIHLLTLLAHQTGAALARGANHRRNVRCTEQHAKAHSDLAGAQKRLRVRTRVHETIEAALGSGEGEQAITDALHELIGLPIALEDRFGNLRSWSGPGRPMPYPMPDPQRRQRQLAVLAERHRPTRMKNRVEVLIVPRGEILGVLAIIDPDKLVAQDHLVALQFACTLLGYELSHQRSLVDRELSVRREFVEDLLAGTDDDGAFARSEALGHDLRPPHYVVVVHSSAASDSVATGAGRAAAALHLNRLQGRSGKLVVLLTEGRPDPQEFYRALSELLGRHTCAIGIGSRCEAPSDFPMSFAAAKRGLNVRLHSAVSAGASAYDELGFYRLIDVAHAGGAVEDFVREWIGALLEYDSTKKSELVLTLSEHLESGGNYDDTAEALHIHRSTLVDRPSV